MYHRMVDSGGGGNERNGGRGAHAVVDGLNKEADFAGEITWTISRRVAGAGDGGYGRMGYYFGRGSALRQHRLPEGGRPARKGRLLPGVTTLKLPPPYLGFQCI
jgi:hypothetical protein